MTEPDGARAHDLATTTPPVGEIWTGSVNEPETPAPECESLEDLDPTDLEEQP